MDKIESLGGFFAQNTLKPEKKKVDRKGLKKTVFSDVLETMTGGGETGAASADFSIGTGTELEELLDDIHSLGEELKNAPTLDRIVTYKKAVRGFLNYVVRNSLKVEEHESRANILNRKRFTLINIIDQKLERLAAGVLANQQEQILLLSRVDEIQGLLVDLLH